MAQAGPKSSARPPLLDLLASALAENEALDAAASPRQQRATTSRSVTNVNYDNNHNKDDDNDDKGNTSLQGQLDRRQGHLAATSPGQLRHHHQLDQQEQYVRLQQPQPQRAARGGTAAAAVGASASERPLVTADPSRAFTLASLAEVNRRVQEELEAERSLGLQPSPSPSTVTLATIASAADEDEDEDEEDGATPGRSLGAPAVTVTKAHAPEHADANANAIGPEGAAAALASPVAALTVGDVGDGTMPSRPKQQGGVHHAPSHTDVRAATAPTTIGRLKTHGRWFQGADGRTVLLRGVNLGSECKAPSTPDERTFFKTDFSQHRTVSFVNRPFPLSEAPEHFGRLRHWGFNCLRMMTSWEAVEHAGPGEYDQAYLDYFAELCRLAGEYGFYLFVDFHQDAWSRMSGGDGAPGWVYEKLGIDCLSLAAADAALVMQYHYDFNDPRKVQEDHYPVMCWSQNYRYAGNAIPWTLFFAGRIFTPAYEIDGVNVQDFMQGHYIGAMKAVAERLKDMPHVLGFDTLNEPSAGWIGVRMSDRRDETTATGPALPGIACSPVEVLYSSYGHAMQLPQMELQLRRLGFLPGPLKTVNKLEKTIWLPDHTDPFLAAGAYELTGDKETPFRVLKDDFFRVHADGRPVNLNADVYFPFFNRVADAVHAIRDDWLIFAEREPMTFAKPTTAKDIPHPSGYVNAAHWYDGAMLGSKTFNWPFTLDLVTKQIVVGTNGIGAMYRRQMRAITAGSEHVGPLGCPTLLGEFGIPFDLGRGAAYKQWAASDHSDKPWQDHIVALDLMYNAMDTNLVHGTQWVYSALNQNDLRVGDGCTLGAQTERQNPGTIELTPGPKNEGGARVGIGGVLQGNQEDLSIYSRDQATTPDDPWSGGRALKGFVRPRPLVIQGEVIELKFARVACKMHCTIRTPATLAEGPPEKVGTVFYIPQLHYRHGFEVTVAGDNGAIVLRDEVAQRLVVSASLPSNTITVTVTAHHLHVPHRSLTDLVRSWM